MAAMSHKINCNNNLVLILIIIYQSSRLCTNKRESRFFFTNFCKLAICSILIIHVRQ